MKVPTALRTITAAALVAAGLGVGSAYADQPAPDAPDTIITQGQTRISTDKASYLVGEPITIRYSLPARGYIRITDYQGEKVSTLRSGYRNSAEDSIRGTVTPPAGKECLTLEYSPRPLPATPPDRAAFTKAPSGQGPAYAETCFDVMEKKTEPTPTPTPAPSIISGLSAQAFGTEATLSFTTSEPATVTLEYKPVTAMTGNQLPSQGLATTHERKLTGLKSNTTYDVTVTARTQSGEKHTAQTRFTTSKQRVRVTLREINIERDGDTIGDGEPRWKVFLKWGADGPVDGCYPNNCKFGSYGDGPIFPKNSQGQFLSWTFAEENFDRKPDSFQLDVWAEEDDPDIFASAGGGPFANGADFTWTVPQDKEWASVPVYVRADQSSTLGQDFKSEMAFTFELFHDNLSYPAAHNAPQSTWGR